MKTKTPNLTEMGVLNPEQIISYVTVHVADDMDVLKIYYPLSGLKPPTSSRSASANE